MTSEQAPLIGLLVDLLSYCIQMHAHKSQYFVLSNPLAQKVCSLVYAGDKTLRHCELSKTVRANSSLLAVHQVVSHD